jgi:biopolymer transport protein ExbD
MIRRASGRRCASVAGEEAFQTINITPFTDILLVLLIIFLIAGSSLRPTGVEVDKLRSSGPETTDLAAGKPERTIRVGADGRLTLVDGLSITKDPALDQLPHSDPLNLTAAPDTRVEVVIRQYDHLLKLGFRDLRLAEPES